MSRLAADLREIVGAVEIASPRRFFLRNGAYDLPESTARETPVDRIAELLYETLYTRSGPRPPHSDPGASRALAALLSRANSGQGTWQPGWTLMTAPAEGLVSVEKQGLVLWSGVDGFHAEGGWAPGSSGRLLIGKELRDACPGFYIAIGDGGEVAAGEPVVRVYWHFTPAGVAAGVRCLTSRLNAVRLPFRLKVPSDPSAYSRADSGVLYLGRSAFEAARAILADTYGELSPQLGRAVPRLTKAAAPGLALAVDPGDGSSFGQHRCRIVAQALWSCFASGEATPRARARSVESAFLDRGLDPKRPYLGAGLAEVELSLDVGVAAAKRRGARRRRGFAFEPLAAAAAIGEALCREAHWHGGRCNWLGRAMDEAPSSGAPLASTVAALGPDVYDGTAGVALFLAELHRLTGEAALRRTAEGAIQQALAAARARPRRLGLFCGDVGVGFSAVRVGSRLGLERLEAQGRRLLLDAVANAEAPHALDLLSGSAGAIAALLSIAAGRDPSVDAAERLGEELLAAAIEDGGRVSWETRRATGTDMGPRGLCGLSHGAAGMGFALLALHARTGRLDFRDAGLGAFDYEDAAFDERRDNWPDFRTGESARDPRTAGSGGALMMAWCHGAPGIGLARLRALGLLRSASARLAAKLEAALGSTRLRLAELQDAPASDASPCHGVAGLVELLLEAGRGLARPELLREAARAWSAHAEKSASAGAWVSGVASGGPNPSLMLGTAGVGYSLLRLHDPTVPSLLLPS